MRNSLLFKLLGAFLLILTIGGLISSALISNSAQKAFSIYTSRSGQILAKRLGPILASYYEQSNNWLGVETVIETAFFSSGRMSGNPQGMMSGHGNLSSSREMIGALGQHIILTDEEGIVLYDSINTMTGEELSDDYLEESTSITSNDSVVGYLLISPEKLTETQNAANEFIDSIHHETFHAALIAGGIALVLGAVLFTQITAPMRKLSRAASAIANGDLSQRVDIKGKDEFGELGNTFNKMAESLSQAETQRQHLMADVAHELRNPLTAIQGTLEAMQDGVLPCDPEQLDSLYSETQILNRLIGDLRLLSLAETNQLKLEKQEIDLNHLIDQIADRAQPLVRMKNISLETSHPGKPVKMILDPDRITQVINNLMNNAIRYTPESGKVTISTTITDIKSCRVSVTDTGPGIDPVDLPFVFDRFYRADKSRSRASGGSGLGLAIVKELVEAHGGQVMVESPVFENQEGQKNGTRFSFEIKSG